MPPRCTPVVRAVGVVANTQNNERHRRGRRQQEGDAGNIAQPAAVRPGHEKRDRIWTLDSEITDVLLEEHGGTLGITVDDFLQRYAGGRIANGGRGRDPLDQLFTHPDRYISRGVMGVIHQSLSYQCFRAAYDLFSSGIWTLGIWEETTVEVKERFPLSVIGMLNDAVKSARRCEALIAPTMDGEVIKDVFNSVFNAKWSHVVIDKVAQTLNVRIVDGPPSNDLVWTDAEVNTVPTVEEIWKEAPERTEGLELLVLTSEVGWPYTGFEHGMHSKIYIRREELRVWNVVEAAIRLWRDDRAFREQLKLKKYDVCSLLPRSHIVIGNPGIGKSQNLGSFLLYKLLRHDADELPIVVYFFGRHVYIFDKAANNRRGTVRRYTRDAAKKVVKQMESSKEGYIIYDIVVKSDQPSPDFARRWGSVLISSPNTRNFDSWEQQREKGVTVVVNSWAMSEMKAFYVCCSRILSHGVADHALEDEWLKYKERVEEVGPSLRHVFVEECYKKRVFDITNEINSIKTRESCRVYTGILTGNARWDESNASHKVVKVVRFRHDGGAEHYVCRPHSKYIQQKIINTLCRIIVQGKNAVHELVSSRATAGVIAAAQLVAALQRHDV